MTTTHSTATDGLNEARKSFDRRMAALLGPVGLAEADLMVDAGWDRGEALNCLAASTRWNHLEDRTYTRSELVELLDGWGDKFYRTADLGDEIPVGKVAKLRMGRCRAIHGSPCECVGFIGEPESDVE